MEQIQFLSGVLLVSREPGRLAAYYRDVLSLPLEAELHEGALPHWGCTLGDVHFAVHPMEDFPDRAHGVGSVKLAFTVFDLEGVVSRLRKLGVSFLQEPINTGYFISVMLQDPDGNLVELTQLCDEWFKSLEQRRSDGFDVLARWREQQNR